MQQMLRKLFEHPILRRVLPYESIPTRLQAIKLASLLTFFKLEHQGIVLEELTVDELSEILQCTVVGKESFSGPLETAAKKIIDLHSNRRPDGAQGLVFDLCKDILLSNNRFSPRSNNRRFNPRRFERRSERERFDLQSEPRGRSRHDCPCHCHMKND